MVAPVSGRGSAAVFTVIGLALALSGCQSNPLSVLGGGSSEPQQVQTLPEGKVTQEELLAYCPAVSMRELRAVHDTYQRGGDGDASKLVYRATLADATRACTYGGGMTNLTIAVAGRVIPGPAGAVGTAQLPLQLTVYRDNEVIQDKTVNHPVAIADTVGATQFVLTDTTISIPNPQERNIRVLVGFNPPKR
ncbi:hypothetical protein [Aquamicrobium zhengzhouense]|uniref:Lipoprotein n=1 Tax=Aquamicrobium zhengzhouense TaxID=2781738 RepID=A0ABS0SFC2_9HYPH|nr:hypothetical protein [Aquamicrobium zhengzhouense]MBI1622004.1 hypothetical protein [Aquamicrobium zhengzhouense]